MTIELDISIPQPILFGAHSQVLLFPTSYDSVQQRPHVSIIFVASLMLDHTLQVYTHSTSTTKCCLSHMLNNIPQIVFIALKMKTKQMHSINT